MAKELYLYSGIYSFTAVDLVKGMEDASGQDITLRINSPGGDVFAGWGIIAKMLECKGKTTVKVDGAAMSMAVMPVVFADYTECLDVSTLMIHRAAMTVENSEDQAFLDNVNKNLRSKLESKIDDDALFSIKNIRIKNIFEDEKRTDIFLNAKESKQIGLIDKINKLTPELGAQMSAMNRFKIAATAEPTQTKTNMTKAEFKAANPAAYEEIFNEGKTTGATSMKEVAQVWNHFAKVDAEAATKGLESGVLPTPLQTIELTTKMASAAHLKELGRENAGGTHTGSQSTGASSTEKIIGPDGKEMDATAKADFDAQAKVVAELVKHNKIS